VCRYLEAAPNTWSVVGTDPTSPWATTHAGCYGASDSPDTDCETGSIYLPAKANASRTGATAIGMGMANTTAIVARYSGVDKSTYAAGIADSLYVGGKSDWFLPSKDELNQFYIQNPTLGGVDPKSWWSSSEFDATYASEVFPASYAWAQYWRDGYQFADYPSLYLFSVRPVRAF
jgi:hypothetical protein